MLAHLITSKTRLRMLLKFFLHEEAEGYLREIAREFGDSANAVRLELQRLSNAELLQGTKIKNTIVYKANVAHPFYADLQFIIRRYVDWYGFTSLYIDQKHKLKGVYLCEIENEPDAYVYTMVEKEDCSITQVDHGSLAVRTATEEELETWQRENKPCICVWKSKTPGDCI